MKAALNFVLLFSLVYHHEVSAVQTYQNKLYFSKKDRDLRGAHLSGDTFFHLHCGLKSQEYCNITRITNVFNKIHSESKSCEITVRRKLDEKDLKIEALDDDRILFVGPEFNLVDMRDCSYTRASFTDEEEERIDFLKALSASLTELWDRSYSLKYRNEECKRTCNVWIDSYLPALQLAGNKRESLKLRHPFQSINESNSIEGVQLFLFKHDIEIKQLKEYPKASHVSILSRAHNFVTVLIHPKNIRKSPSFIAQFSHTGEQIIEMPIYHSEKRILSLYNQPDGGFIMITGKDNAVSAEIIKKVDINGQIVGTLPLTESPICQKFDFNCFKMYVTEDEEYCLSFIDTQYDESIYEVFARCFRDEEVKGW